MFSQGARPKFPQPGRWSPAWEALILKVRDLEDSASADSAPTFGVHQESAWPQGR